KKWPVFYIGKSKQPRCFGKRTPEQHGFWYRNNKTAWMTSAIFEQYPTNICIEFFEPNMTSFVQPLDAGIIRCFKAHYRRAFCLRAVELDEAGDTDIYKINLLEVMLMVKEAWAEVSAETIKNCWQHAFAIRIPSATSSAPQMDLDNEPTADPAAWDILIAFANGTINSLPEAEKRLTAHLGDRFSFAQWKAAFDEILKAEDDESAAVAAIEVLKEKAVT
ncbi:hypothetical protein PAXINDRAFT_34512, partial [Paxillus involutus ATCC 200175]